MYRLNYLAIGGIEALICLLLTNGRLIAALCFFAGAMCLNWILIEKEIL